MKNIHGLKILFFLMLICRSLFCQWEQCNGPYGGYITSIAIHDTNIFVTTGILGAGGSVFLSTNSGENWKWLGSGLENQIVTYVTISADGSEIFALSYSGVSYSKNNGTSWTNIGTKLNVLPAALAVYTNNSGRTNVIVGTFRDGIFLSRDLGKSWEQPNSGFKPEISSIYVIGSRIFACTWGQGLYFSTDEGKNWKPAAFFSKDPYGTRVWEVIEGPDSSTLFACGLGVFISKDNGENWTVTNSGMTGQRVNCLALAGNNLFAGTDTGVYRSANNAKDWQYTGLKDIAINAIAVQSSGDQGKVNLFAGDHFSRGVFLSTNMGESWTEANEGLTGAVIIGLIVMPDKFGNENLFAGYWGRGIMRSTDNGTSWTNIGSDLSWQIYPYAFSFHGKYLAASTQDRIYLSSDYGQNWNDITKNLSGCSNCNFGALLACSDNEGGTIIFLGTNGGLYRTKPDSTKYIPWELINIVNFDVGSLAVKGKYIFAAVKKINPSPERGLYRSMDNGTSWTEVDSGLPAGPYTYISALQVCGQNIFAAVNGKGVYLSSDDGDSWHKLTPGLPDSVYVNSFALCGTNLFASSRERVYLSTVNGTNWKEISGELPAMHLGRLAPGSSYLFLGTDGHGVWRLPLSGIVSDAGSPPEVPVKFSLEQNYPNPFNPTTTIKFTLPYSSNVTLKIYDLLGREVITLINEVKPAGVHMINWKADNLSSGIYFYEIMAGNFSQTKKMILLR